MLVLSQEEGDRITLTLPDNRTIDIVTVTLRDHRVRLGIEAPDDVTIVRENAKNKQPRAR